MQAASGGVRGGSTGYRLPGTGDTGRVRNHLPGIQSRLLWLLRPEGGGQSHEPQSPLSGDRYAASPLSSTHEKLQCLRASISTSERRDGEGGNLIRSSSTSSAMKG